MTNDNKQIDAAFEGWWPDTQQDQIWLKPLDAFSAGYKAALEASHAQYVEGLVEALNAIVRGRYRHDLDPISMMPKILPPSEELRRIKVATKKALAALPEELRG